MITGKTISSMRVIEKLYRDHDFADHLELPDAFEWIGDMLGLFGVNQILNQRVCTIPVEDYRASIPEDLVTIDLITRKTDHGREAMRYEGDPFMIKMHCSDSQSLSCESDLTYRLNDNFIFTSFEEGDLEIAYYAYPIDENGYPLIPDDAAVIEAMTWHIAYKIAYKLWKVDELRDKVFQFIRQQKDWYVGKAISRGKSLSQDEMETLKNMSLRLIPKVNAHYNQFRKIGKQEHKWNHNTNNFNQGDRTY